jgi:phospholipid/cholesterol/gamma-HCH transport system ATP-binding protein
MAAPLRTPGPAAASLEVCDVWSRFEDADSWIHRGVDLEVAPGESLVVIGGSGSGKSVLLRHLVGLSRPERGRIVVDGLEVTSASEQELYGLVRHVGVLFQFGALFDSLCVWENVTFALQDDGHDERELRAIAAEKLKMVGLRGVEDRFPGELSGGMRKRVGLARAIAHEPHILFCDEPTSGLDPVMADMISELILQMKERLGVTTLTITHDMTLAYKIADRIAMLYEGRIRAVDRPEGIRRSNDPIVQQFVQGRALGAASGAGPDAGGAGAG